MERRISKIKDSTIERERLAGKATLVVKKKGMIKTYINFEPSEVLGRAPSVAA